MGAAVLLIVCRQPDEAAREMQAGNIDTDDLAFHSMKKPADRMGRLVAFFLPDFTARV